FRLEAGRRSLRGPRSHPGRLRRRLRPHSTRRRARHAVREQPLKERKAYVMSLARSVAIGGAVIALIGFFIPWVEYQNGSFSGATMASQVTAAGGLRGFDVALYLVPIAAIVTIAFALWSARAVDAERETRLRLLGAAAAVTGLAIALLFLGSAVLG